MTTDLCYVAVIPVAGPRPHARANLIARPTSSLLAELATPDQNLVRLPGSVHVPAEDGWTPAELETHMRDEHSTFSQLLESMLERAGLAIEEVDHSPSRVLSAYLCRRRT